MKKVCLYCGKEFKSTGRQKIFCCLNCGAYYRKDKYKIREQEALERARAILDESSI